MRLIDADLLIEEINKVYAVEEKEDLMWAKGLHYAKAIVNDIPTIETDASTLLKEQEAVEPEVDYICGNIVNVCGKCKSNLIARVKFCPWCGQAVKW